MPRNNVIKVGLYVGADPLDLESDPLYTPMIRADVHGYKLLREDVAIAVNSRDPEGWEALPTLHDETTLGPRGHRVRSWVYARDDVGGCFISQRTLILKVRQRGHAGFDSNAATGELLDALYELLIELFGGLKVSLSPPQMLLYSEAIRLPGQAQS